MSMIVCDAIRAAKALPEGSSNEQRLDAAVAALNGVAQQTRDAELELLERMITASELPA